jgi:hypothetical protein
MSPVSLRDWSEGGAFVHNLIGGKIRHRQVLNRFTPYHFAHSTQVAGLRNTYGGDNRFYNNLFVKSYPDLEEENGSFGLAIYNDLKTPSKAGGNMYYIGAKAYYLETEYKMVAGFNPDLAIEEDKKGIYLVIDIDRSVTDFQVRPVTAEMLGITRVSGRSFDDPQGNPVDLSTDIQGEKRDVSNPIVGPFAKVKFGKHRISIWKK